MSIYIPSLSIGDWLQDWESKLPMTIEAIYLKDNQYMIDSKHYIGVRVFDLDPIPLTEDILKANGWEGTPTGDMYIYMPLWDDYMIEVLPSEGANIFRFLNKQGLVDMYKESVVLHFHYVHELQHALRLCGLTELAENFKVRK